MRRILQTSKYDPKHLNDEGNFSDLDEWTDISQVGQIFGDKKFVLSEYIFKEDQYIAYLNKIHSLVGVGDFKIESVENHYQEKEVYENFNILVNRFCIKDHEVIDKKWYNDVIRLNLRGIINCPIKLDFNNSIFFGDEMYVYVITNNNIIDTQLARNFDLFSYDQTHFRSEDHWFW
jgi:hypothetical protein